MDSLTMTGMIATILGGVFALAAFWNSRHRQKHERRLRDAAAGGPRRLHVKPMPAAAPPGAPVPAPAPPRDAAPVFKQVTPSGATEPAAGAAVEEQGYVWE